MNANEHYTHCVVDFKSPIAILSVTKYHDILPWDVTLETILNIRSLPIVLPVITDRDKQLDAKQLEDLIKGTCLNAFMFNCDNIIRELDLTYSDPGLRELLVYSTQVLGKCLLEHIYQPFIEMLMSNLFTGFCMLNLTCLGNIEPFFQTSFTKDGRDPRYVFELSLSRLPTI